MNYKEEFNKIASKAINRESEKEKIPADKVHLQLLLKKDADGDISNGYRYLVDGLPLMENGKEVKLSFTDILGVKIDLKGYSLIVPRFIKKVLLKLSVQHGIPAENISAIVRLVDSKVRVLLYNQFSLVKELQTSDMFSDSVAMEIMQDQLNEQ